MTNPLNLYIQWLSTLNTTYIYIQENLSVTNVNISKHDLRFLSDCSSVLPCYAVEIEGADNSSLYDVNLQKEATCQTVLLSHEPLEVQ